MLVSAGLLLISMGRRVEHAEAVVAAGLIALRQHQAEHEPALAGVEEAAAEASAVAAAAVAAAGQVDAVDDRQQAERRPGEVERAAAAGGPPVVDDPLHLRARDRRTSRRTGWPAQ